MTDWNVERLSKNFEVNQYLRNAKKCTLTTDAAELNNRFPIIQNYTSFVEINIIHIICKLTVDVC